MLRPTRVPIDRSGVRAWKSHFKDKDFSVVLAFCLDKGVEPLSTDGYNNAGVNEYFEALVRAGFLAPTAPSSTLTLLDPLR